MENFERIFKHIRDNTNIDLDDKPILIKNAFDNPDELCDWSSLELAVNTPHSSDIHIIGSNSEIKEFLPYLEFVNWSKHSYYDHKVAIDLINEGDSLIAHRWEDNNLKVRNICQLLDQIYNVNSSAHVYAGLSQNSKSFYIHADNPSNIIFQIDGKTEWSVYSNRISTICELKKVKVDESKFDCIMNDVLVPGDILYIPSRMYHLAQPMGRRISISFPCWKESESGCRIDRNYYPIHYQNT